MNHQLAINCSLTRIDGHNVKLSIAPTHKHLLGKSREKTLATALGNFLGKPAKLEISVSETIGDTPAGLQQVRDDQRLQSAQSAIDSDDAVQAMKDAFGAHVQPGSVQPVD